MGDEGRTNMICMYSRIWVLQRGNRSGKDSVKLYFLFDFISFWIVLLRETNYDDDYSEREAGHGTKTVLYYIAFFVPLTQEIFCI